MKKKKKKRKSLCIQFYFLVDQLSITIKTDAMNLYDKKKNYALLTVEKINVNSHCQCKTNKKIYIQSVYSPRVC